MKTGILKTNINVFREIRLNLQMVNIVLCIIFKFRICFLLVSKNAVTFDQYPCMNRTEAFRLKLNLH